jgi:hypothetical protein
LGSFPLHPKSMISRRVWAASSGGVGLM